MFTLHGVVFLGLLIRLALVCYGAWQDANMAVKYTDIDYIVLSDGAKSMWSLGLSAQSGTFGSIHNSNDSSSYFCNGNHISGACSLATWNGINSGPFARSTFRYSPLLAIMLLPDVWTGWPHVGKLFFCILDVSTAILLGKFAKKILFLRAVASRQKGEDRAEEDSDAAHYGQLSPPTGKVKNYYYYYSRGGPSHSKLETVVASAVLFNPLVANVSTRGNMDITTTFLCVAALFVSTHRPFVEQTRNKKNSNTHNFSGVNGDRIWFGALLLGVAVHVKIYPILLLPATLLYVYLQSSVYRSRAACVVTSMRCLGWFVIGAGVPTVVSFAVYGQQYLAHAVLYHIGRIDHRHNFSSYFYSMYLGDGEVLAKLAFIPQIAVQAAIIFNCCCHFLPSASSPSAAKQSRESRSSKVACNGGGVSPGSYPPEYSLLVCYGLQLFYFVAFNKVITVQYFVWYLPLLTAAIFIKRSDRTAYSTQLERQLLRAVVLFGLSIAFWLAIAYMLEFKGMNVFLFLWFASCLFFSANIHLGFRLIRVLLQ